MIFRVEVDEFWLEEEKLSTALEQAITHDVMTKVKAQITEKVDKFLIERIKEMADAAIQPMIDQAAQDYLEKGNVEVRPQYGNAKGTIKPFRDFFRQCFGENVNKNTTRHIETYAKRFGEEMKLQYNAAFANQIVVNLKEQGMLKDEVVNALLTGPGGK